MGIADDVHGLGGEQFGPFLREKRREDIRQEWIGDFLAVNFPNRLEE
jgi:hypothetical protein